MISLIEGAPPRASEITAATIASSSDGIVPPTVSFDSVNGVLQFVFKSEKQEAFNGHSRNVLARSLHVCSVELTQRLAQFFHCLRDVGEVLAIAVSTRAGESERSRYQISFLHRRQGPRATCSSSARLSRPDE